MVAIVTMAFPTVRGVYLPDDDGMITVATCRWHSRQPVLNRVDLAFRVELTVGEASYAFGTRTQR